MRRSIVLALVLAGLPAGAAPCPTRPYWPTVGFRDRIEETAARRAAQIEALEDYAFTLQGADPDRIGVRTDAVVIVAGGDIVYERYGRGYLPEGRHIAWSVSKSVMNALAGIAVGLGLVDPNVSICRYVTLPRADHCDITLTHLLEFASGLAWKETYEGQSNQVSSVLAMLYGEGQPDMLAFIAGHDARDPPGATYMYSSGDTTFLTAVLHGPLTRQFGVEYAWPLLFDRLGMTSAVWETDGRHVMVGSSYLYATPRDLARFGFLYLNDGCWEGERILPEGWVADSTAVSPPFKLRPLGTEPGDVQGRQFWLNRPVPEQSVPVPMPHVPEDAYAALGHWGQSLTIVPSRDVVVVRTADDRDGSFDRDRFVSLALAVAE
jgi:CubicO group peptidase (beta-lactamase class C family)